MWEGSPIYSVWGFLGSFSPNLQKKLASKKKESIVELGRNLKSILVLDKVTTLGARWTQQKTQCMNQFSAWQNKEQYYSL